jgi:hypothetical protein
MPTNTVSGSIAVPLGARIGFGVPDTASEEPTGPSILVVDGDPNGVVTAPVGTLALDPTGPALWQNAGESAWIAASATNAAVLTWNREVPVENQGGNSRTTDMRQGQAIRITAIFAYAETAPTTAGSYDLFVTGAGNNLLADPSFDLTSLDDDDYTSIPLTDTPEHLELDARALTRFIAASDNGDLAGSGILLVVEFQLR